ncbi:hypothetical protein [Rhizobium sp. ICMP 5592]|uniref:hypothetical protein n=1 Tax=Rhizobium sp. ICMP 5592 TaxID=2292445 RepID=UPI001297F80E|nr:hypothetical protein [Rhizobium sp. ICMP 5592]MQB42122.1 hypothetical protein [Rhizobium sp. ICMP 5592]
MTKTVILGQEHDQKLRDTLMDVLRQLGASLISRNRAVAGSQEIETVLLQLAGQEITIEAETYVGLSITGDEKTISEILGRVRQAIRSIPI